MCTNSDLLEESVVVCIILNNKIFEEKGILNKNQFCYIFRHYYH